MSPDVASAPDLLRLLSLPIFAWVAYRDVRTRRVPSRTWLPIGALAIVLLAWDALAA
jgi:archaeal preflagellin peptidase FlaK